MGLDLLKQYGHLINTQNANFNDDINTQRQNYTQPQPQQIQLQGQGEFIAPQTQNEPQGQRQRADLSHLGTADLEKTSPKMFENFRTIKKDEIAKIQNDSGLIMNFFDNDERKNEKQQDLERRLKKHAQDNGYKDFLIDNDKIYYIKQDFNGEPIIHDFTPTFYNKSRAMKGEIAGGLGAGLVTVATGGTGLIPILGAGALGTTAGGAIDQKLRDDVTGDSDTIGGYLQRGAERGVDDLTFGVGLSILGKGAKTAYSVGKEPLKKATENLGELGGKVWDNSGVSAVLRHATTDNISGAETALNKAVQGEANALQGLVETRNALGESAYNKFVNEMPLNIPKTKNETINKGIDFLNEKIVEPISQTTKKIISDSDLNQREANLFLSALGNKQNGAKIIKDSIANDPNAFEKAGKIFSKLNTTARENLIKELGESKAVTDIFKEYEKSVKNDYAQVVDTLSEIFKEPISTAKTQEIKRNILLSLQDSGYPLNSQYRTLVNETLQKPTDFKAWNELRNYTNAEIGKLTKNGVNDAISFDRVEALSAIKNKIDEAMEEIYEAEIKSPKFANASKELMEQARADYKVFKELETSELYRQISHGIKNENKMIETLLKANGNQNGVGLSEFLDILGVKSRAEMENAIIKSVIEKNTIDGVTNFKAINETLANLPIQTGRANSLKEYINTNSSILNNSSDILEFLNKSTPKTVELQQGIGSKIWGAVKVMFRNRVVNKLKSRLPIYGNNQALHNHIANAIKNSGDLETAIKNIEQMPTENLPSETAKALEAFKKDFANIKDEIRAEAKQDIKQTLKEMSDKGEIDILEMAKNIKPKQQADQVAENLAQAEAKQAENVGKFGDEVDILQMANVRNEALNARNAKVKDDFMQGIKNATDNGTDETLDLTKMASARGANLQGDELVKGDNFIKSQIKDEQTAKVITENLAANKDLAIKLQPKADILQMVQDFKEPIKTPIFEAKISMDKMLNHLAEKGAEFDRRIELINLVKPTLENPLFIAKNGDRYQFFKTFLDDNDKTIKFLSVIENDKGEFLGITITKLKNTDLKNLVKGDIIWGGDTLSELSTPQIAKINGSEAIDDIISKNSKNSNDLARFETESKSDRSARLDRHSDTSQTMAAADNAGSIAKSDDIIPQNTRQAVKFHADKPNFNENLAKAMQDKEFKALSDEYEATITRLNEIQSKGIGNKTADEIKELNALRSKRDNLADELHTEYIRFSDNSYYKALKGDTEALKKLDENTKAYNATATTEKNSEARLKELQSQIDSVNRADDIDRELIKSNLVSDSEKQELSQSIKQNAKELKKLNDEYDKAVKDVATQKADKENLAEILADIKATIKDKKLNNYEKDAIFTALHEKAIKIFDEKGVNLDNVKEFAELVSPYNSKYIRKKYDKIIEEHGLNDIINPYTPSEINAKFYKAPQRNGKYQFQIQAERQSGGRVIGLKALAYKDGLWSDKALIKDQTKYARKGAEQEQKIAKITEVIANTRTEVESFFDIKPLPQHGTNYAEFYHDGIGAFNKIKAEKSGQVSGAFHRSDLGDIDLVWGAIKDKNGKVQGYGLSKIVVKHKEITPEILDEAITNGELKKTHNGYNIIYKNYKIGLNQGWNENGVKIGDNKWIVTAYDDSLDKLQGRNSATFTKGEALPLNQSEKGTSISSEPFTKADNLALNSDNDIIPNKTKFSKAEKEANLKEWHKDSHEITKNADGSPKVFYHGSTARGITEFDPKFDKSGYGFWFSPESEIAKTYKNGVNGDTGEVYKVYLNVKNPIDLSYPYSKQAQKLIDEAEAKGIDTNTYPETNGNKIGEFKEFLKSKGYDGITTFDYDGVKTDKYVIVFDSSQIKSVKNKGEFNPNNPNIMHSNSSIGGGLLSGSVSGIQTDENGNIIGFDPAKFALGFGAGFGAMKLGANASIKDKAKALKQSVKQKQMQEKGKKFAEFCNRALRTDNKAVFEFGEVSKDMADKLHRIKNDLGQIREFNFSGYTLKVDSDTIRHIKNNHPDDLKYLTNLGDIYENSTSARWALNRNEKGQSELSITLYKKYSNGELGAVEIVDSGNKTLNLKTFYKVDKE